MTQFLNDLSTKITGLGFAVSWHRPSMAPLTTILVKDPQSLYVVDLPKPSWTNSDRHYVEVHHKDEEAKVTLCFEYFEVFAQAGEPDEILRRKNLWSRRWIDELDEHFQEVERYFGLGWTLEGNLEDIDELDAYHLLSGSFSASSLDRILSLLLEIRLVLAQADAVRTIY